MSNPAGESAGGGGRDEMMSALFASLVMQNTNMALIFMGHAPNPQTGQTTQNLDHARHFIDLLEMLAAKTTGNLDKAEESLLKQSLTSLRLAFVEAVEHPQPAPASGAPAASPSGAPVTPPTDEQETPVTETAPPSPGAAGSESRKKFSKKY